MECRDLREMADSFLSEELMTETNHLMLRHLDGCPSCRMEIDARRRVRSALRAAVQRAPELQPSADFSLRLRDRLRTTYAEERGHHRVRTRWLALAAGVVLTIGLAALGVRMRSIAVPETLAGDAVGGHWSCALKHRLFRNPVPLEEAARRFDGAYRLLLTVLPEDIPTAGGPVRVVERHSCAYGPRRFGHVILHYQGRVVSLLVTTIDGASGESAAAEAAPYLLGRPIEGFSVVSVPAARHAVLLVGDLSLRELTQLARAISVPLSRQLLGSVAHAPRELAELALR
jgi:hypothetical protein